MDAFTTEVFAKRYFAFGNPLATHSPRRGPGFVVAGVLPFGVLSWRGGVNDTPDCSKGHNIR